MYTIRELASRHGLSRSTLLYYDEAGLLRPTTRTHANYRLYDDVADARLAQICQFRETGLALREISKILGSTQSKVQQVLQKRLSSINGEISELRNQQKSIVELLKNTPLLKNTRFMDKEQWVELLELSGFSHDDMVRWHQTFESHSPEAHQDFLESLGIQQNEIATIRDHSNHACT